MTAISGGARSILGDKIQNPQRAVALRYVLQSCFDRRAEILCMLDVFDHTSQCRTEHELVDGR